MEIWSAAIKEGYPSSEARDLANLELTGQLFHTNEDPNNSGRTHANSDDTGINANSKPIPA